MPHERPSSSALLLKATPIANFVCGCTDALVVRTHVQGVDRFLAGCKVPRAHFNAAGRGFPDVSAVGVSFQIVINGKVVPVGGTSASSPTFAAILSLINSERLSRGKEPLGWANPLLHAAAAANAAAYHDVTIGNNAHGQCGGFNATVGWDPMTGWGTPNFPALAAHLIAAP